MTPLVWANLPLGMIFALAFIGVPLWMTFKRPQTPPDNSQAHAYLRARDRLLAGEVSSRSGLTAARRHAHAAETAVPGRQHWAGAGSRTERSHQAVTSQEPASER